MTRVFPRKILVAAAVAVMLAAACGDDSGGDTVVEAAAADDATDATPDDGSMNDESMNDESMNDESMDDESMDDEATDDHEHGDDHEHADAVQVPAEGAPTVRFEATENVAAGGADLVILTENFEIVDDGSTSEAPYFGHAHVFVGDGPASMIFSDRYTVTLAPGENVVRVELSDVDHAPLQVDGVTIAYEAMVHIPESPADEFHVHEMETGDGHSHDE